MVKIYYPDSKKNLGDIANPLLMSDIFKLQVLRSPHAGAELLCVGSILGKVLTSRWNIPQRISGKFKTNVRIWTSGFIDAPPPTARLCRKIDVFALRGALSRGYLESICKRKFDVPLGDGGLFIPDLVKNFPSPKYEIGIIPHYKDLNSPAIDILLKKLPGARVISPLGDVVQITGHIAECGMILSSSLHGLIVADAMNIPNRHIVMGENVRGGDFKFRDYYSAYKMEHSFLNVDDVKGAETLKEIKKNYIVSHDQVVEVKEKLHGAFPRDITQ